MIRANSRVREDAGKVALVRDPVTYCLESVDNGTDLRLLSVGELSQMRTEPFSVCQEKVLSIVAQGYRGERTEVGSEQLRLFFSREAKEFHD